jgi:hypothetical protein
MLYNCSSLCYIRSMYLIQKAWTRTILALYFASTVLLSSIIIHIGSRYSGNPLSSLPLHAGIITALVHFCLYLFIMNLSKTKLFVKAFICTGVVIIGSIIGIGLVIRGDYFRSAFHALAAIFIVFLYKYDLFNTKPGNPDRQKIVYVFAILLSLAGFGWIFVLGYNGIIIGNHGAIRWMGFNLYTVGILAIGFNALFSMHHSLFTHVRITEERIFINRDEYTFLLGKKDILLLHLLINAANRQATCSQIFASFGTNENSRDRNDSADCGACIREKRKATLCSRYRSLYNQILKLKKFLETMKLGTIVAPENKMNIVREGWSLKLFEGIRFHN